MKKNQDGATAHAYWPPTRAPKMLMSSEISTRAPTSSWPTGITTTAALTRRWRTSRSKATEARRLWGHWQLSNLPSFGTSGAGYFSGSRGHIVILPRSSLMVNVLLTCVHRRWAIRQERHQRMVEEMVSRHVWSGSLVSVEYFWLCGKRLTGTRYFADQMIDTNWTPRHVFSWLNLGRHRCCWTCSMQVFRDCLLAYTCVLAFGVLVSFSLCWYFWACSQFHVDSKDLQSNYSFAMKFMKRWRLAESSSLLTHERSERQGA